MLKPYTLLLIFCVSINTTLATPHPIPFDQRLKSISARFLNTPYLLGALGEGPQGIVDQRPLYRTDRFDCETLITTTLATALAQHTHTIQHWMNTLRYAPPHTPSYLIRNHFPSIDWNSNAHDLGVLTDITPYIQDHTQHHMAQTAQARIDRLTWLKHTHPTLKITGKHRHLKPVQATLTYIPLTDWTTSNTHLNTHLLQQLPPVTLIQYVRLNWTPAPHFGTQMLISHMAFLIKEGHTWIIREASSRTGKVSDTPLLKTLLRLRHSNQIAGFHLERLHTQL